MKTLVDGTEKVAFIPASEFLDLGRFTYQEDSFNLNPLFNVDSAVIKVSMTSIASVVGHSPDTV